ncbi:hypothetical protein [Turicibacter sp. TJ11]|uniref:hypothetical protein n=1 Tax=Turicibacter sp. TJ11 TaxID=2806443 RepID=UPI001F234338|nr:hypothetical protein [Turicibacter sp. TJ11]
MQRTVSKKPIIILGSLLSLLVIVTVFYILSLSKNKDLQLEQLIETPYEILDIRRNKKEKTYAIDIQGKLSYADNILLSNKLLKELEQHDQVDTISLNMNVFKSKPTISTKEEIDFTDTSYLYTIETNGTYIYQYEPLYTPDLSEDLLFSTEWEIEESKLTKDALKFTTKISDTLSVEEMTSLFHELSEEMIRYNFKEDQTASAIIKSEMNETDTYYYLSSYPNYLIYKTRLIG